MSGTQALAVYGLTVLPNDGPVPASTVNFPARFRITMAAVDPTAPPEADEDGNIPAVPRSTLKLIRIPSSDSDDEDEDDEDDDEYIRALIDGSDEDEDEDEEANGGPSDKSKSKKEKRAEALASLIKAAREEESSDEEMTDAKPSGAKKGAKKEAKKDVKKGKGKAVEVEESEEEEEDDSDDDDDVIVPEEFVLCTLDTERAYQQPLDIIVREDEEVYFIVTGTHAVTVTGNYIESLYEDSDYDSDEEDMDGLDDELLGYSDEEDDLDDLRVTELDSDDDGEDAPALVPTTKKGKNKRAAAVVEEEEAEGLDAMIKEAEPKLSKKQAKKLKNNKGEAVEAEEKKKDAGKGDKKVQFAKELEQGPSGSVGKEKEAAAKTVRVVQGVTIDDRKVGTGRSVKNGDTVGMRYIGKLESGKQFDANKKGKPFSFKVGKGEVIKGWDVGVLGLAIGGERRLTVPAAMAYGNKALPGIPAKSTLIFDVKLLEIK